MKGLTIVYTGTGKGKTTAALGLALRAAGWGKRVIIIQFLKKQASGEIKFFKDYQALNKQISKYTNKQIKIEQFGTKDFVNPKHLRPVDYEQAKKGWARIKKEIRYGKWELVILDEINVAVKFGLIKADEVLEIIKIARDKGIDLVLTGRAACPELVEWADLVTEFVEIKHPYKKGIKAKKGIDY